jgi:hypothetical protein
LLRMHNLGNKFLSKDESLWRGYILAIVVVLVPIISSRHLDWG